MRRVVVIFLAGIFLCSSMIANGRQASPTPAQAGDQAAPNPAQDCSRYFDAMREAMRTAERDRRTLAVPADSAGASEMDAASPRPVDLQQDLKILEQKQTELSRCTIANSGLSAGQDPSAGCSSDQLLNFQMSRDGELEREIPIWHVPDSTAFFYEAGMTIDADGAPNAYHPDNIGLDDLKNAGSPGNWQGLAKDADGEPFVQGPDDPFPGYYVSATALADRTKPVNDPTRYVDASKIPFIVLPGGMARQMGARPGDFAFVFNQRNGKSSYAIFGDVGPSERIGEGSMALAENLGIRSDARNGGARRGILFLVFPGSGNGRPRPIEEINSESEKLLQAWGRISQLIACTIQGPARPFAGNQTAN
jgi:glycosyl hydrolase group 75 (putative chitosanase)